MLKLSGVLCAYVLIGCIARCFALSRSDETSLDLNASCETPNDKRGSCISIYDCSVLYDQLTSSKQSTIDFLRASDCGVHQDVPLVCCGPDSDYDDGHLPEHNVRNRTRSKPAKESDGVINLSSRFGEGGDKYYFDSRSGGSSGIADRSECGFMAEQDRILDGLITNMDEFPWMALLRYARKSDGTKKFLCGGSLIGKRYILTAAHCVTGETVQNHRLIGVRLGEYNILEERDCLRYKNFVECADPPLDVGIERVTAHPRFDDTRKEKPNDIALIRLDRDISYTDYIRPICLPKDGDFTEFGQYLTVAGWGRTETALASAVKLKLRVPKTTRRYCRNTFRKAGANIRDTHICAGGERGRDSCTGDSGGPLMTVSKENTEQWYVEGIVSFGTTCGTKGWPGVYTQVSSYLNWIDQNVY